MTHQITTVFLLALLAGCGSDQAGTFGTATEQLVDCGTFEPTPGNEFATRVVQGCGVYDVEYIDLRISVSICNACPEPRELRWESPYACDGPDTTLDDDQWCAQGDCRVDQNFLHPIVPRFSGYTSDGSVLRNSCTAQSTRSTYDDRSQDEPTEGCIASRTLQPGERISSETPALFEGLTLRGSYTRTELDLPALFRDDAPGRTTLADVVYCAEQREAGFNLNHDPRGHFSVDVTAEIEVQSQ